MKNKEELPTNSDRGALQPTSVFRLENGAKPFAKLLRPESTDPASDDQPALSASSDDALMELIFAPRNLERAWRQVKRNRGAHGPDSMTIKQFEAWARENWSAVRQQLLDGTYQQEHEQWSGYGLEQSGSRSSQQSSGRLSRNRVNLSVRTACLTILQLSLAFQFAQRRRHDWLVSVQISPLTIPD